MDSVRTCGGLETGLFLPVARFTARVLLTLVLVDSSVALACSCAPADSEWALSHPVDAVFLGKVVSITERRTSPDSGARASVFREVCFSISSSEKGSPSESQCIHTGMGGGDCGYPFESGRDYRVRARWQDKGLPERALTVSRCDVTRPLEGFVQARAIAEPLLARVFFLLEPVLGDDPVARLGVLFGISYLLPYGFVFLVLAVACRGRARWRALELLMLLGAGCLPGIALLYGWWRRGAFEGLVNGNLWVIEVSALIAALVLCPDIVARGRHSWGWRALVLLVATVGSCLLFWFGSPEPTLWL